MKTFLSMSIFFTCCTYICQFELNVPISVTCYVGINVGFVKYFIHTLIYIAFDAHVMRQ